MGIGQGVMGAIETDQFGVWQKLLYLVEQEALAAAYIKNFGVRLQLVAINQGLGDGSPTPIYKLISTISIAAI